jgi:hypothetical protein
MFLVRLMPDFSAQNHDANDGNDNDDHEDF